MTRRIAFTNSLFVGIAMLLLPCSMAASAQELMQVAKTCVADVRAQCPGVRPGGGRIRECIKTHLKDLSEPCQTLVLKAVAVKNCAADVTKLCADNLGRIEACMKDHLADVSEPCKEAMANAAAGEDDSKPDATPETTPN